MPFHDGEAPSCCRTSTPLLASRFCSWHRVRCGVCLSVRNLQEASSGRRAALGPGFGGRCSNEPLLLQRRLPPPPPPPAPGSPQRRKLPAAAGVREPGLPAAPTPGKGSGSGRGGGGDAAKSCSRGGAGGGGRRPPPLPLCGPCHLPGKMNACPIHHPAVPEGAGICSATETY